MRKSDIIKFVDLVVRGEVDKKIVNYILSLKRAELKLLLFYLKKRIREKTVNIFSADKVDIKFKNQLEKIFSEREVNYFLDTSLGAGLRIEYGDNIMEISLKNTVLNVFKKIRESI